MSPRQILLSLAAVLVVAGIVLGMRGISADEVSCGSVFQPSSDEADQADFSDELGGTLVGGTPDTDGSNVAACDSAISDAKPFAYGALGLGVVALIASLVASSAPRSHASSPGTPQQ